MAEETLTSLKETLTELQREVLGIRYTVLRQFVQEFFDRAVKVVEMSIEVARQSPLYGLIVGLTLPALIYLDLANNAWGIIFDALVEMFAPEKPLAYEQALDNARKFVTIVGDLNMIATLLDALGKTKIFGSKLGFDAAGRLVTNISWTFGLGWLTWVALGPIFRYGIGYPIERELRRRVRDRELTVGQLCELLRRCVVSLEEFKGKLAEMGYPDDAINKLISYAYRLLTLTDLRRLYEHGRITYEQFVDELKKLGYDPDVFDEKLESELLAVRSSELRRWVDRVETLYVHGYRSDEDLNNAYDYAGYEEVVKKFKMWDTMLRAEDELNDLKRKEIERAFIEGRIDEEEAVARLSEFIKRPEYIEALIAYWKTRRKPEEPVDPMERLRRRLQRLLVRVQGMQRQIKYLKEYERERKETYAAMIEEVTLRYNAMLDRLKALYEARINAVKATCEAYAQRTIEELQARIAQIDGELNEWLATRRREFNELLAAIRDETLLSAGVTREELSLLFEALRLEELFDALQSLMLYATREDVNAIDRLLDLVKRGLDLLERRELLKALVETRLEERAARCEARIEQLNRQLDARASELSSRLEARVKTLKERMEDEQVRIKMRIERMKSKLEEYLVEIESIKRQLQAAAS